MISLQWRVASVESIAGMRVVVVYLHNMIPAVLVVCSINLCCSICCGSLGYSYIVCRVMICEVNLGVNKTVKNNKTIDERRRRRRRQGGTHTHNTKRKEEAQSTNK